MEAQRSGHISSWSNSPTSSLHLEKGWFPSAPTKEDSYSQVSGWRKESSVIPKCFFYFLPESRYPNKVAAQESGIKKKKIMIMVIMSKLNEDNGILKV